MKLTDERIMELAELSPIWYAIPQGREKYLLTEFARAIEREAYKNGQEAMRERAAALVAEHYDECEPWLEPSQVEELGIEEPK